MATLQSGYIVWNNIPILQVTETPERVCKETPTRNALKIAVFIGEEPQQYFLLIEQNILCQVPSFQLAVFIMFSAYYAFHLEYAGLVKNVLLFFQDYVPSFTDGQCRTATYLATLSHIKKLYT